MIDAKFRAIFHIKKSSKPTLSQWTSSNGSTSSLKFSGENTQYGIRRLHWKMALCKLCTAVQQGEVERELTDNLINIEIEAFVYFYLSDLMTCDKNGRSKSELRDDLLKDDFCLWLGSIPSDRLDNKVI